METLYIIGGSGFIGKNMVQSYYDTFDIIVVDKYIDNTYFAYYPNVKTIQLDLVENEIPTDSKSPDYIINLASIVTAERDLSLFDDLIKTNLKVLLNLFNRFKDEKQLKLFIQFGSSEEYGNSESPFVETTREQPNSPYALIKQLTTNTTIMLNQNYGFPAMVVRPGNLFGPLQHISKFIPYVIDNLKKNRPLNVSLCEQKRDFIHVSDFALFINHILKNHIRCAGNIINVSSGESISLRSIIEHCKEKLHSSSIINYGALLYRENEAMDLKCSVHKLEQQTNTKVKLNIYNKLNGLIN
jgi:UDP-glucose 4-epimerase